MGNLDAIEVSFVTHYKYLNFFSRHSEGLKIVSTIPNLKGDFSEAYFLKKKTLINLIRKSLDEDLKAIDLDISYANPALLWIPIKSYYLIYHLLSVIEYLGSGDKHLLSIKHIDCMASFGKKIGDSTLQFNNAYFNLVADKEILNFTEEIGEHLRISVSDDTLFKLAMKKIAVESHNDYQRVNALNLRTSEGRSRLLKFRTTRKFCFFDYLYVMRIKASYKGLSFLDRIPDVDACTFIKDYCSLTVNIYNCLEEYISNICR
jgi:hypothetical protein